jgi:hypothetical protein
MGPKIGQSEIFSWSTYVVKFYKLQQYSRPIIKARILKASSLKDKTWPEPDPSQVQARPEQGPSKTWERPEQDPSKTRARPEPDPSQTRARPEQDPSQAQARPEQDPSKTRARPEQDLSKTQARPKQDPSKTQARPKQDLSQTRARKIQAGPMRSADRWSAWIERSTGKVMALTGATTWTDLSATPPIMDNKIGNK